MPKKLIFSEYKMQTKKRRARKELQSLSKYLEGEVVYEEGIQMLKLNGNVGAGTVKCVFFDDGLVALEFDISLRGNKTVHLNGAGCDMVYFLYCLEGNCFHKFSDAELITKLEELQTAVVGNDKLHSSKLMIQKDKRLILNLIRLDKERYLKKLSHKIQGFNSNTIDLLNSFNEHLGYFHLGKINLEIGELIKMLEKANYVDDLAALMQFEGICHLILAKQITQFKFETEHGQDPSTTLLKDELRRIGEIKDFIELHPEVQHSISTLCRKSGLSAAKLQEGFRFLQSMTVGEFIRETRLKKAELLLRTTEMNISEVVYSIGFTSRSYFCKIFKVKYRCSPKQFKKDVKRELVQVEN